MLSGRQSGPHPGEAVESASDLSAEMLQTASAFVPCHILFTLVSLDLWSLLLWLLLLPLRAIATEGGPPLRAVAAEGWPGMLLIPLTGAISSFECVKGYHFVFSPILVFVVLLAFEMHGNCPTKPHKTCS